MKTKLLLPLLFPVLLALNSGCVTTSTGEKKLDVDRVAHIAGTAAYLGGSLDLLKHPEHRKAFKVAVVALASMEDSENYSAAELAQALQGLNIRELSGAEGVIYIQAALFVWDEALKVSTPITQQELVKAVIPQVRDGLQRALDGTKQ